jgi:hypothetical protein
MGLACSFRREILKAHARLIRLALAALLVFNLNAQSVQTHIVSQVAEPPNLGLLKTELKAYHDCTCTCGCYTKALDLEEQHAMAFLERAAAHKKAGEKLALVLDIDDTSLSTWPEISAADFGFVSNEWQTWAESASAPVIPGTLRLFKRAQELRCCLLHHRPGRHSARRHRAEPAQCRLRQVGWPGVVHQGSAERGDDRV